MHTHSLSMVTISVFLLANFLSEISLKNKKNAIYRDFFHDFKN